MPETGLCQYHKNGYGVLIAAAALTAVNMGYYHVLFSCKLFNITDFAIALFHKATHNDKSY